MEESKMKKMILLGFHNLGATEWMGLMLKEGKKMKQFQFHRQQQMSILPGTCACMGKIIYMVGHQNKRSHSVSQFTPDSPSKPCAHMLTRRSKPHTAVVRGTLFVLGDDRGFGYGETGPWAEVYHPALDKWYPLPPPEGAEDKYRYSPMMTAVLHSQNKILLSFTFSRHLLAFNVDMGKWEVYDTLDNSLPFSGRALAVDGVLYRCQAGVLYAYHLENRLTLYTTFAKMDLRRATTTTTKQFHFDLPSDVNPFFHHLGDHYFCFIWRDDANGSINFVKFQLSICFNLNLKPYLHSPITSIDSYVPNLPPQWKLADSLMLDGLMESFDNYNEAEKRFIAPTSTPFIAPPPIRPFAGPMGYTGLPSPMFHVAAPHPESLRGMPCVAPVPHAKCLPTPDPRLHSTILNQIDYYFSNENLCKDPYLRRNMDDQGWVPVKVIAGFQKVLNITANIQLILDALRSSTVVEVQGDKVRKRNDWMRWLMPSVQLPNVSATQGQGNSSHDMLAARVQNISLEQKHYSDPTVQGVKERHSIRK